MKSVLFGYPNADSWRLALDDVSARERGIALKGELRVGFFQALTPMCIPPATLSRFAADLRELDSTLAGSATLEGRSKQSAVRLTLTVNHIGHIHAAGRYEINGNVLDFNFRADQTQLGPLVQWLDSIIRRCENAEA
ncbi:MAG TPA: hypothetical protein VGY56_13015 [Verrucomicrobiae bacterium]|nr:hypothetical protein [Verrucomicrobiae bacterium]